VTAAEEITAKQARVAAFLEEHALDGLLLARPGHFAWITAGADNGPAAPTGGGCAAVMVTRESRHLLGPRADLERLEAEELAGQRAATRHFGDPGTLARRLHAVRVACDHADFGFQPLPAGFHRLTAALLPPEVERYCALGEAVATAVTHACFHCRPGLSEHQVAGMVAGCLLDLGVTPVQLLVGADDRADRWRRPVPTARRLEQRLRLSVWGRRHGLHLAMTRLVWFAAPDAATQERMATLQRMAAALVAATRPGVAAAAIPEEAVHHSPAWTGWLNPRPWLGGGSCGYAPPGFDRGDPDDRVLVSQPYAWRLYRDGLAAEDTVLAAEDGPILLSATPDLPHATLPVSGRPLPLAGILVR
jgi:Xaa-Pro aminopeptidase